ncbi:thioesterase II family protein [Micromonospora halophytica]|uniref:Surfactin synthase thioesterase subunit n=1 Tax=Micromonospora halophytica TaxID=47864 RepID=A0A1C5HK23_9ACTN|nr:alpha/beta fold hydrolase [Micromonospora halophytica]SCG46207.1 Surfactin synthase thioesterase subunit [Micromonospora halophytica]
MPESAEHIEKWVRRFHPAPDCAARLVCLAHAGGSASFFHPVSKALAPEVEVLAVQYPGRQDRRHEPAVDNIADLADHIFDALRDLDDRPLALFGHSMGAVLGYEVALRRQHAGLPSPAHLFVSGRRAPSRYRDERVHHLSDDRIVSELRALSGTQPAMLADPEVLEMILPAIRSDYHAIETYRHDPDRRLDCPVTVFTGASDPRVSIDEARAWEEHTTGPTDLKVLPGGHFFLVDRSAEVIATVRQHLMDATPTGEPRTRRATVTPQPTGTTR